MKMFKDRIAVGELLVNRLRDTTADLVLGIPRGGVVVAKEVAGRLNLPLDIIVTRKIGAPTQEELALGAVDADGEMVWDEQIMKDLGLKAQDLTSKINEEIKELRRREQVYRQGKEPLNVQNKTVILVDDGIATGATSLSAVKYLKRHGAKVILAVPVTSSDAIEKLKQVVDQAIVLEKPEYFEAVAQFYEHFEPVTDEEVVKLLSSRT